MNKITFLCLSLLISPQLVWSAQIDIFSDNFNRQNSTSVNNGWLEIDSNDNEDVRIINGTLQMKDDGSAITHLLNTTGINELSLTFDWLALSDSDNDDFLKISWSSDQNNWNTLYFDQNNDKRSLGDYSQSWHHEIIDSSLLSALNNLDGFYLQFWIDLSGLHNNKEGVRIDNFSFSGYNIVQNNLAAPHSALASVPEPSVFALLGIGLISILSLKRHSCLHC